MAATAETSKPTDEGTKLIEQFEMARDEPEVETVAAPSAEPVVETPPPAPKHPKWVMNAAKQAGLADDELAEMSKDDILEAVALKFGRDREMRQELPRDDSGRFAKQEAPPPPEPEYSLKELGIDPRDLEVFDENTQKMLTAITKPLYQQVKELKEQLAEVGQRESLREADRHADLLDEMFAENEDVFGNGNRRKMNRDSVEFETRMNVIREMGAIHQTDKSLKIEDVFEKAASKVIKYVKALKGAAAPAQEAAPVAPAPVEPPKTNGKLSQEEIDRFKNGRTALPANRSTAKPPKGVKAAEAAVGPILQRMTDDLSDELAGLPGDDD